MNLLQVQNRIVELMARWVAEVKGAASMSHTDLNIVSETILVPLLREVYGWSDLRNLNTLKVNFPAIDLANDTDGVVIQVTATATTAKIKHTLTKFVEKELYDKYDQLIVYILVEKQKTYSGRGFNDIIDNRFMFDKDEDIRDYRDLLAVIQDFQIDRAKRILDILEANFGGDALPPTPAPYQAPRPLREFVGRTAELERLGDILIPGARTAITGLVGMGGLGKTELAKLAASRVAHRFRDGVLWADCAQQDLAAIADLWAGAYKEQLSGDDPASKAAAWRGLISAKEALLIFDNLQPHQDLEPLFPPSGRSAVLITTRHGNHPDLHGSERLNLDQFTPEEATALAEKTLGEEQSRNQADAASPLFELLGYLPLAISVALHAAAKSGWSLATLHTKLKAAGALTILGDDKALKRTLNATFKTAWENLPDDLLDPFRTLSLFNQGPSFSTQALADTLDLDPDDAGALLHRLAGRSLLTEEAEGRWSLHPLLREFVATLQPPDHAAHLRFARHYEQVARAADDQYMEGGDNALQALALFDLEWPHIRAGQAWAAAHAGDDDEAARLCSNYARAVLFCLDLRRHPRDWIAWLEAALRAARHLGDKRAESYHLANLGEVYRAIGEWDRAIAILEQVPETLQKMADFRGVASAYNSLGAAYAGKGEWDRAIECYEQARAEGELMDDMHAIAMATANLGEVYVHKGESERAIECYEQASETLRQVGDIHGMARATGNLGGVYRAIGEWDRAIEFYEQSLAIEKQLGDIHGMATTYYNLACLFAQRRDPAQALPHLRRALNLDPEHYCRLTAEDTDFDAIRDEPSFQALLAEYCPS